MVERSGGFPLYVRFVVGEIIQKRLAKLDGSEPLPRGVGAFYDRLLSRGSIGAGTSQVTPQVLCLLAAAREPLTREQLEDRQHCPMRPILDQDDGDCDEKDYVERSLVALTTMLVARRARRRDAFLCVPPVAARSPA